MKKLIIDSIEKQRILNMHESVKNVPLNEGYLPNIKQGDELCDIICERKQAKYGANGDVVKEIQHALAKCGYNAKYEGGGINEGCKTDKSKCDGLFRKETQKAVREFQSKLGIGADGAVGKKTLEALKAEGCIELPQCNCEKKQEKLGDEKNVNKTIKDENKSFLENQLGIPNIDCDKIVYCIRNLINSNPLPAEEISVDALKKCLSEKLPDKVTKPVENLEKKLECGNCPKGYVNCMPGTSKPDPYCSNKMLRQYCETMCGTKVAV